MQDEEVGFAYISQREAQPSLYEYLAIYQCMHICTLSLNEADKQIFYGFADIH